MIESWKKLTFTQHYPKTDLFRYRAMAYLMIPEKNEINRFLVKSARNKITFYICSSSEGSLQMLESFFTRLYACRTDPVENPLSPGESVMAAYRVKISKSSGIFYYPALLQNIAMIASATENSEIGYEIVIMNKNNRGYAVLNRLHVISGNADIRNLKFQIKSIYRRAHRESKIKLKPLKTGKFVTVRKRFSADPSMLMNFIRIPEDERLV
ncbi:MAG: hypothetical protein M1159_05470 [Candidatus Thermoplasmatota archaeon]|nr:hypothetical protein [Candidatus Thermoplasmatota archaeon]